MNRRTAFTLVELLVVIAIIALLMAVLLPALNRAREQGKRIVCMNDVKQLTTGWNMYADTYNDKLVNGSTATQNVNSDQCPDCPTGAPYMSKAKSIVSSPLGSGGHDNELPWVGGAYNGGQPLPEKAAKCAIQTGALFKYVGDFKVYRCPTGNKGEMITYNFVDAMNGMPCAPPCSRTSGTLPGWIKNRNQIKKSASQIVFIDEGRVTPDSFAVYFGTSSGYAEKWFDPPEVRHGDGTILSFADSHADYWKWSKETAEIGKIGTYNQVPTTPSGKQDLYRVQIGCWGRLGYNPTITPKVD